MNTETIYTVYILQSQQDQSYYIGYTSDLELRLADHNAGNSRYTSKKRPWRLVYTEQFYDKTAALKREKEMKRKKKHTYLEWLIQNHQNH